MDLAIYDESGREPSTSRRLNLLFVRLEEDRDCGCCRREAIGCSVPGRRCLAAQSSRCRAVVGCEAWGENPSTRARRLSDQQDVQGANVSEGADAVSRHAFLQPPLAAPKGKGGFTAMNERKYAIFFYWGPFGHENNHEKIMKVNDLINSFDWLSVKKNEAYPVFTNASTNDLLPWPDQVADKESGQVNAFFRWRNLRDTRDAIEMLLFLTRPSELKTTFTIPAEAMADVGLRRLQTMRVAPRETVRWVFGGAKGEVQADTTGCITIPRLKITAEPATLSVGRAK